MLVTGASTVILSDPPTYLNRLLNQLTYSAEQIEHVDILKTRCAQYYTKHDY